MAHLRNIARNALICSCTIVSIANALQIPRYATVTTSKTVNETSYDFVIAGGGIAGLTVADRLTEDPNVNVLVIESGPFDQGEAGVLVPGAYNPGAYLSVLESVPQPGLTNKSYIVPIGHVAGGGSVVNAMVWMRSGKAEYDAWEANFEATGWTWDSMLPYFIKSENFTAPDHAFAHANNISFVANVHGHEGPVQVSFPNFAYKASRNWWSAAKEVGFVPTPDPNGGNGLGIAWFETSVDFTNRSRSDARLAHYTRVDARPNYHILAENAVSKILLKGTKAVGVEFLPSAGGDTVSVFASKEVLVAAGAVHTPGILQRSGIGPKNLLKSLGIPVVANLPGVGANFHDTPQLTISYNVTNDIAPNANTFATNATYNAEQLALYESSRQGAYVLVRGFSTNVGMFTLCNASTQCLEIVAKARATHPATYLPAKTDPTVIAGYAAQREVILSQLEGQEIPVGMLSWGTGSSVILFLWKGLSRGTININSTNPLAVPPIDYRAMSDPTDYDLFVASFLQNRKIMQAPSMAVLGAHEGAPFGDQITNETELKSILATTISPTGGHACCTAAMLPLNKGGVVDPDMKVYGIEGLRVIDISHFPMIVSSPPQPAVYASSEKIADVIKFQHCLDGACLLKKLPR